MFNLTKACWIDSTDTITIVSSPPTGDTYTYQNMTDRVYSDVSTWFSSSNTLCPINQYFVSLTNPTTVMNDTNVTLASTALTVTV